jgi:hypothetical protein
MNDPIAALLYLLGRHVATALRVRREDEEIVLSRHQAPPLRELHDALERGEQITIDPWVDLEDGARGLVCLWARTPCPEVTVDDLPAALRPQAWVRQGGSALVVWSLAEPNTQPGGIDPARAMREIAAALGITACDPRDYIPVPRDPQDLVIIEPGRDIDGAQMVQWAQSTLSDRRERQRQRREQQDAVRRVALYPHLLRAVTAIAAVRRVQEETASPPAIATVARGGATAEDLRQPEPDTLEEAAVVSEPDVESQPAEQIDEDPWVARLEDTGGVGLHGHSAISPDTVEPLDHANKRVAMLAPSHEDDTADDVRERLARVVAEARRETWDEARLHATLVAFMAELGTRDVWAALGVTMTSLRNGTLHGLRGGQWVSVSDLLATG